ncbi:phage tail protein [Aerococcus sp. UMB8608]|uniref:Phage tail protein n=1 Tax=Aerococcus sanguinicola TaxID=119206 RepID=A0A109RE13_9LACT|nr:MULTISPECIES: major tail protein [Aerococcus]AMB94900.1 hypothetical protein AWM72_09095 [Aerococcus sanguinicola]MDK6679348.1 phage tail protein [Aerococcus sp. UMB8608]MDK6685810.1 phage tail protein [Aerococcus sp. UMB8623]OFT95885.1 hypothetical protein HMPREF3090_03430 [Aerococcus sp. HMSC23C02]
MADKNKVQFGLENVHYASVSFNDETGQATYGKVKSWPGAVELSLEPNGDPTEFNADNTIYYYNQNNQGYEGSLETAKIPDDFRIEHLGEVKNTDGTIAEFGTSQSQPFALMFEFSGDANQNRHLLYYCSASRSKIGSKTKSDGEPNTETLEFKCAARPGDKLVKIRASSDLSMYEDFFKKVYEPVKTSDPLSR